MEGMSSSGGLEIGISCIIVPHFVTGGQKHTHTHTHTLQAKKNQKSRESWGHVGVYLAKKNTSLT
jgi:hypothetical protein